MFISVISFYVNYLKILFSRFKGLFMREIMIKTNTSDNKKRRNLCMTEIITEEGMVARAEKRYSYFVTERKDPITKENMQAWIEEQATLRQKKPRHVSIRRIFDNDTGIGQTLYRTTGSFYVLKELKIFVVVFLHSVKFDVLSSGGAAAA